jgi:hypothetical protein
MIGAMVELGVTALASGGVGAAFASLRARSRRTSAAVATCGCSHPRAVHDLAKGVCRAEVVRPHYMSQGARNGHEYIPCPCVNYDGPRPVEEFFASRIETPREHDR